MFASPQWNDAVGRPEMQYKNQQDDLIMVIRWNPATKKYEFDVGLDEATRLGRQWGPESFDAAAELKRQRPRLYEMERSPPRRAR
ncbi:MAG: hypothetical protein AB7S26_34500 [Sandaracinaceae bacterium]